MNNKEIEENFFEGERAIIYGKIGEQKVKVEIPVIKDFGLRVYPSQDFSTNRFNRKPRQGECSFSVLPSQDEDQVLFSITKIRKKAKVKKLRRFLCLKIN